MSEEQIEGLASHLVQGLIQANVIKPKADVDEIIACVTELFSIHFEEEAEIDAETEQIVEQEARNRPGVDPARLRAMVRRQIAEKRNFPL